MAEQKSVDMAKMQAEAQGKGIPCPACGCCDSEVLRTTRADGSIVRRRLCRHCGNRRNTFEGP